MAYKVKFTLKEAIAFLEHHYNGKLKLKKVKSPFEGLQIVVGKASLGTMTEGSTKKDLERAIRETAGVVAYNAKKALKPKKHHLMTGDPHIVDVAVRHLMVGDEEEIRLTEDWDAYWPDILNDSRLDPDSKDYKTLVAISHRVAAKYIEGKDYDKAISILSKYVSYKDIFKKDLNTWIDWVQGE